MEENEELQEIQQLSEQEIRRMEAAQAMFVQQGNPLPKRRMVNAWDVISIFGLEVVLRIASTVGAALVSATAVGAVMEITVKKLLQAFQATTDVGTSGIFYWSMLAFEGGLMASGMTAGRKNGKLNDSDWALYAGFAVTITAGLLRSLTLLGNPNVEFWLSLLFGLVVGAAGPIISYYGSENFGHILEEIRVLQNIFDSQWKGDLEEWRKRFEATFPRIAKQVFNVDRRRKVRYEDEESPRPEPKQPEHPAVENLRALVKSYLKQMGINPSQVGDKKKGALISPSEIADALQLVGSQRDDVRKYNSQFKKDEDNGRW
jgi:hypothetical protein